MDDGRTNKKALMPIIHVPYLDIGDDLEFERGVATPLPDLVFRKA